MDALNIDGVESLLTAIDQGFQPDYLFFWGHRARRGDRVEKQCLSQWFPSPFTVESIDYPTAEHYMMAEKARLFGDCVACERILSAPHPRDAKKLGREVQGFDNRVWVQHRLEIVVRGNEAKFRQNEALRRFLLDTGQQVLVEASPVDRIWGIGLAEDNPKATNPAEWSGINLLGFALMEVRRQLK